jgi:hypothetical protein
LNFRVTTFSINISFCAIRVRPHLMIETSFAFIPKSIAILFSASLLLPKTIFPF